MKILEINIETFQTFVSQNKCDNFLESSYMKTYYDLSNTENKLLGLYDDDNTLVGATLLVTAGEFLNKKLYRCNRGVICDFQNLQLVNTFLNMLFDYVKDNNGYRLIIEPYTDSKEVIDILNQNGYSKTQGAQMEDVYCVDFDKPLDELFKGFKQNTRNIIQRCQNKFQLTVKTLSYDELDIYAKIIEETASRKGFASRNLEYYQRMYKAFGDNVQFNISILDCSKYLKVLETEINQLQKRIEKLGNNEKKKANVEAELEIVVKKKTELLLTKEKHGNEIVLSGAMFLLYGTEGIYLFSGSYQEFLPYYGQYILQWDIIQKMYERNFASYNMLGIADKGVLEFKKGFSGYSKHYIGAFEKGCGIHYKLAQFKNKVRQ